MTQRTASRELWRFSARLLRHSIAGAGGGVVLALGVHLLDTTQRWTLPLPAASAQAALAAMAGASLTLAVFSLWMRTVVVGIAAGHLSARVLVSYLDDRFQRHLVVAMVAGFSYLITTTAVLPHEGAGVPAIGSVLAVLITVVMLLSVLVAMHHAVRSLSLPDVVRVLADQVMQLLERPRWPDDPPPVDLDPATLPDDDAHVVRSAELGWIQGLDHEGVLGALPPDSCLVLHVTVGDFVGIGDEVATVTAPLSAEQRETILEQLVVTRTRSVEHDLAFAIQQLVDVAQHAVAPGSADTSTAYEALVHLRALLFQLLRRGTATGCARGDDGRCTVTLAAWRPADHLVAVFDRLRVGSARDPLTARYLHGTLHALEATAVAVGDRRSVTVLQEQRELLVAAAEAAGTALPAGDTSPAPGATSRSSA